MNDFFDNIVDDVQIEQQEQAEKFVPNWSFVIQTKELQLVDSVISKRLSAYIFSDKSEIEYRKEITEHYKIDGRSLIKIDVRGEFKSSRDANDFLDLFYINDRTEVKIIVHCGDVCAQFDVEFFDNPKSNINTLLENRCDLVFQLSFNTNKEYDKYIILKKNIHLINGNICSFLSSISNELYKNPKAYGLIAWDHKRRYSFKNLKSMLYKINDFNIKIKLYAARCHTDDYFYSKYDLCSDDWFVENNLAFAGKSIRNDSYMMGMTYTYYEPFHSYTSVMFNNLNKLSSRSNTIYHGLLLKNENSVLMFTGLAYDTEKKHSGIYLTAVEFNGEEEDVQNALNYLLQ